MAFRGTFLKSNRLEIALVPATTSLWKTRARSFNWWAASIAGVMAWISIKRGRWRVIRVIPVLTSTRVNCGLRFNHHSWGIWHLAMLFWQATFRLSYRLVRSTLDSNVTLLQPSCVFVQFSTFFTAFFHSAWSLHSINFYSHDISKRLAKWRVALSLASLDLDSSKPLEFFRGTERKMSRS